MVKFCQLNMTEVVSCRNLALPAGLFLEQFLNLLCKVLYLHVAQHELAFLVYKEVCGDREYVVCRKILRCGAFAVAHA